MKKPVRGKIGDSKPSRGRLRAGYGIISDLQLARQGEILRQIQICDGLLAHRQEDAYQELFSVRIWQKQLLASLSNGLSTEFHVLDVDPGSPDKQRASDFWTMDQNCVANTDAGNDSASQLNVEKFLLHVAWHEGARLTTRVQGGGGPGRSFFQFEAYRAKETVQYANGHGFLGNLATVSNQAPSAIMDAANALPDYGTANASYFPDGNLIQDLLTSNDLFGIYLARIAFRIIADPIPPDNTGQAAYWYKWWKRSGGDPASLEQTFKTEADEVDALLAATQLDFAA